MDRTKFVLFWKFIVSVNFASYQSFLYIDKIASANLQTIEVLNAKITRLNEIRVLFNI